MAKEVGPQSQLGDHYGPVGMGDHAGHRGAPLHRPARPGRGNGWEGGIAACCRAPDHTRGRGHPALGGREAPTLARPYCPGNLARPADATSHHLVGGGGGHQHPGALPWLRDCMDASPPPTELLSALEGLFGAGEKHVPRHHLLVATDHTAELSDDTVALVADTAQCLAPHAIILPREGWEG